MTKLDPTTLISHIFLLLICINYAKSIVAPATDDNGRFKVFQIKASSIDQVKELFRMEQQGIIDIWRRPMQANSSADVMVDLVQHGPAFEDFLRKFGPEAKLLVDDLSKFIAEKETFVLKKAKRSRGDDDLAMLRDDPIIDSPSGRSNKFGLEMGNHYSYAEIQSFLLRITQAMPSQTQLRTIGTTSEGRLIQGIQFGNPSDKSRPVVWIDAGIHAREWTSIHTGVYFINYIASEMSRDPKLISAMKWVDILVFPCLNPDGYEFTRSDPQNVLFRMWRKNRSPERCAKDRSGDNRCCKGVDLNRNFDFKFALVGTSYFPCSEIFHGDGPFSEIETKAVRDAIISTDLRDRINAFVSMHAYSQLFIYPYSHQARSYPPDINDLKAVARHAVTAIGEKYGTPYLYGTGPEIIYAYTGGSADWAKETARIKYTYTIELRPSYWSWNGFVLAQEKLIPTARETWDGVMVVIEAAAEMVNKNIAVQPTVKVATRSLPSTAMVQQNKEQKQPMCEDKLPYCGEWVFKNAEICKSARKTMEKECRRTCMFC